MGKSPDGKPITPYKGSWAETEAAKKRLRRARPTTLEDRVNAKLHAVGEALSRYTETPTAYVGMLSPELPGARGSQWILVLPDKLHFEVFGILDMGERIKKLRHDGYRVVTVTRGVAASVPEEPEVDEDRLGFGLEQEP